MFTGCGTALVTPFQTIFRSMKRAFAGWSAGRFRRVSTFWCPAAPLAKPDAHARRAFARVEITLEEAKGKVPVLAGAGGYSTTEVIELAKEVQHLGADGILSVSPYYNKPTQEGIVSAFQGDRDSSSVADGDL